MADFIFKISPNIILSSYGYARLGQYAKDYGSKFIVIIDPLMKEFSIADKITQSLTDRKIEFFVFDEFTDGATSDAVSRALALAREGYVHGVIAVGGGKALHIGQAVAALYNEQHDLYDYIDGAVPTSGALPLICVPTTPRETFIYTQNIPVCDSRSRQIKMLSVPRPLCKLSLIDPSLMSMLTENQRLSMAMETVCLAVEAYISQKSSFFSDMLAEKSMELLVSALDGPASLEVTTPAEELLAQGGFMASLAAASSAPGMCTLLALAINSRFKISTSLVSDVLLPFFLEDAGNYKSARILRLAQIFRAADKDMSEADGVKALEENIRIRMAKINLPSRLKDLGISLEQLALAVEDAGQLPLMSSLSRSMTSDDLFAIVKAAF